MEPKKVGAPLEDMKLGRCLLVNATLERRSAPRKKVALDLTVPVELAVDEGEWTTRFVRFIDISGTGIGLSGDCQFPEEFTVRFLVLPFDRELARTCHELTLRLRTSWQRELYGGMWMAGFEFVNLDEKTGELVEELIARRTVDDAYRVNRPMGVGLVWGEDTHWFYPWVLHLSPESVELQTEETLIPGEDVELVLNLEPGRLNLRLPALVESSAPVGEDRFRYTLRFEHTRTAELEDYLHRRAG